MNQLNHLTDVELSQKIKTLVSEERRLTTEILELLREVETRRLFLRLGFSSLFTYCTEGLGFSESQAQRRISSMRLLKGLPTEVRQSFEEKIKQGSLNLTNLAKTQQFIQSETKQTQIVMDVKEKISLIEEVVGKSTREAERTLIAKSSQPETPKKESIRVVTETVSEIKFYASKELLEQIKYLKGLLAPINPNFKIEELVQFLVQMGIKKYEPKAPTEKDFKKAQASSSKITTSSTSAQNLKNNSQPRGTLPEQAEFVLNENKVQQAQGKSPSATTVSRYIPSYLRRIVWQRDQGRCTFVSEMTGKRCDCKQGLELDHRKPFAMGGTHELSNLRLRCSQHNKLYAIDTFGEQHMKKYLNSLETA